LSDRADQARAKVVISGRVQGVFFRANTRQMARSLRLTGWVRNRPDGKVEALFEGPADNVRRMVAWCHDGPRLADVKRVKVHWQEPTGDLTAFSVRY